MSNSPTEVQFLTIEHVRHVHVKIMASLGAHSEPLGSVDRLDGALGRVQFAFHYQARSMIYLAAFVAVAISQAQAFADGNKRTALGAMLVFLDMNGFRFVGNGMQVALFLEVNAFLSEVANRGDEPREKGLEAFALWLGTVIEAV
ncbi:hypothetical protein BH09CHL1_BH09CHL1_22650 [soil metagenome]